ncbi:MAG: MT-A70 family methyltransferase [Ktedonobacteraceae bacterium]
MATIKEKTLYRVIYADPPWPYRDRTLRFGLKKREGSSSVTAHYNVMRIRDICELKVPAAEHSYLFLWTTNSFLREAFEVMETWGFEYKTTLTWVKPSIRMGYYFRGRTEHVLFGTRGKPGRLKSKSLGNVVHAYVTKHSQKPDVFYDLIEAACDGPYLEMFARRRRKGWDAWGDQVPIEVAVTSSKSDREEQKSVAMLVGCRP